MLSLADVDSQLKMDPIFFFFFLIIFFLLFFVLLCDYLVILSVDRISVLEYAVPVSSSEGKEEQ